MIEYQNYDRAIIMTGDGDFYCLTKYLLEHEKLAALLIPDMHRFSALLKFEIFRPHRRFMNDLKERLSYKKKRPHGDGTP